MQFLLDIPVGLPIARKACGICLDFPGGVGMMVTMRRTAFIDRDPRVRSALRPFFAKRAWSCWRAVLGR